MPVAPLSYSCKTGVNVPSIQEQVFSPGRYCSGCCCYCQPHLTVERLFQRLVVSDACHTDQTCKGRQIFCKYIIWCFQRTANTFFFFQRNIFFFVQESFHIFLTNAARVQTIIYVLRYFSPIWMLLLIRYYLSCAGCAALFISYLFFIEIAFCLYLILYKWPQMINE